MTEPIHAYAHCGHCGKTFVRKHACRKADVRFWFNRKTGQQRVVWPGGFIPLISTVYYEV